MPCMWGSYSNAQCKVGVVIVPAIADPTKFTTPPGGFKTFTALIDTGAQSTCITPNVAQVVGLKPLGKKSIIGVSGQEMHNYYAFNVGFLLTLPKSQKQSSLVEIQILKETIAGAELAIAHGFDVLLGMDVIGKGSLAVEGCGSFSFSF